jgi:hypothetical protein
MDEFEKIAKFVLKLGSWGTAQSLGAWLVISSMGSTEFNIGKSVVGAVLCVSVLIFDYLVWHTRADILSEKDRKLEALWAEFIRTHPGGPR